LFNLLFHLAVCRADNICIVSKFASFYDFLQFKK